jgi:hypothetical protein
MPNKYFKHTYTVVVLSAEELCNPSLERLQHLTMEGDCVLHSQKETVRAVSGKTMAHLLHAAGSEPAFFNLDDNGKHADD